MPITGLILTLSEDAALAETALWVLARRPELELGERVGCRIPASADTPSMKEDKDLQEWLTEVPGVRFVDVVWAWIEDGPEAGAPNAALQLPKREIAECAR